MRWCPSLAAFGAVAWSLLAGCHFGLAGMLFDVPDAPKPYLRETIGQELGPDSVRTIGCLDVGLVPSQRNGTELVDLHVGNRCGHPEALDLRNVVIRGYAETGAAFDVSLRDPRREIELVHLGGAERAHERIRLESAGEASRLCFHLERIDPDAPGARPTPICFKRVGTGWVPA